MIELWNVHKNMKLDMVEIWNMPTYMRRGYMQIHNRLIQEEKEALTMSSWK